MAVRGGYLGRSPGDTSVIIAKQNYSPTGIQTSFAFDATYTVGYVDVYMNGVRLINGTDYTAAEGSNVDLATNAVASDVIEIVAYKAFNIGNVSASQHNFTVANDLNVSGITTSNGGFVSAASTSACKITFSGQTLTFNVPGVGSTSLTLY